MGEVQKREQADTTIWEAKKDTVICMTTDTGSVGWAVELWAHYMGGVYVHGRIKFVPGGTNGTTPVEGLTLVFGVMDDPDNKDLVWASAQYSDPVLQSPVTMAYSISKSSRKKELASIQEPWKMVYVFMQQRIHSMWRTPSTPPGVPLQPCAEDSFRPQVLLLLKDVIYKGLDIQKENCGL